MKHFAKRTLSVFLAGQSARERIGFCRFQRPTYVSMQYNLSINDDLIGGKQK